MARIMIVEDDENIAELISASVKTIGHEAQTVGSASALFSLLPKLRPDLILLDIMLPDLSGLDILRKLKANAATQDIPVIFLTAKGSEADKVTGLELGAEDYITKPFGVLELLARIKTALRRTAPRQDIARAKDLTIDFASREVSLAGEPVRLTHKEFELLEYLFRNSGTVLSREKLLDAVWGFEFSGDTTRTVDMHIRTLRQKLHDSAENPRYIATVRGYGYKFLRE